MALQPKKQFNLAEIWFDTYNNMLIGIGLFTLQNLLLAIPTRQ